MFADWPGVSFVKTQMVFLEKGTVERNHSGSSVNTRSGL
jgi:hypothetical protein